MRRPLIALSCLLALATVGCQKQDLAKKEAKTEAKICSQLTAVGQALDQVAALKPTSTVGEAAAADKALASALSGLQSAEQTLEKLRLQNFQNQLKTFKGEVARVASNKNQTLEQAAITLKAKSLPVIAARRQLSAAVKCEEPAAATPAAPAKP
jgi:DNA repair exonuclease SbcCD ATPase subunit